MLGSVWEDRRGEIMGKALQSSVRGQRVLRKACPDCAAHRPFSLPQDYTTVLKKALGF